MTILSTLHDVPTASSSTSATAAAAAYDWYITADDTQLTQSIGYKRGYLYIRH